MWEGNHIQRREGKGFGNSSRIMCGPSIMKRKGRSLRTERWTSGRENEERGEKAERKENKKGNGPEAEEARREGAQGERRKTEDPSQGDPRVPRTDDEEIED